MRHLGPWKLASWILSRVASSFCRLLGKYPVAVPKTLPSYYCSDREILGLNWKNVPSVSCSSLFVLQKSEVSIFIRQGMLFQEVFKIDFFHMDLRYRVLF